MRRAAPFLLIALSACFPSRKYREYPPNPYADVRRIIVLPFANMTEDSRLDTDEMTTIFASELVKFPGFEVVRPQMVRAALQEGEKIATLDDAVRVARRLKGDAIVAVAVTDHDPYDPPRTALSIQWLRTSARAMSAQDIDRLIQSATWRGPFSITRAQAGYVIDAYEEMWDAHNRNVRDEIKKYADAQYGEGTAYPDETLFTAVQERWIQFVSSQVILRFIERKGTRGA
ncbi:MAG: hypothetical protein HYY17_12445 [Planctomycetes bacterium]|nr:hypothetical protein [Planctomycetota bacterium]